MESATGKSEIPVYDDRPARISSEFCPRTCTVVRGDARWLQSVNSFHVRCSHQRDTGGSRTPRRRRRGPVLSGMQAQPLASGDKIKVVVFREEQLSGEFEIDGNGRISLPLIGAIEAAGKSTAEVEAQIRRG